MKIIPVLTNDGFTYYDNGKLVGSIAIHMEPSSIYIKQIKVEKDSRRKGYGKAIVKHILKKFNKPLYGFVCTYYAARFWGTFDEDIPTEMDDDELDDWCYQDGWFEVNKLNCFD